MQAAKNASAQSAFVARYHVDIENADFLSNQNLPRSIHQRERVKCFYCLRGLCQLHAVSRPCHPASKPRWQLLSQPCRKDEISEDFGKSDTKSIAMGLVAAPVRSKAEREGFVISLKCSILTFR